MASGTRRSGRTRCHFRRWPRRLLVGANMIAALALISTGTVYAYVHYRINSIHTVAAPHLTPSPPHAQDSSAGLGPENVLLIGNQSRAGLGTSVFGSPTDLSGSLSDVIMILHLDPAKESASILSIPRDLFVPQPAGSPVGAYQKIDAALNDGAKGPDNLIQTITQDFGIPINHYIELNFNGFQQTVNDLGGIKMNFPEPVYDLQSNLNIPTTGCQHLNGSQALALVRSRHLQYDPPGVSPDDHSAWPYDPESDLSRIVRDHAFLRELAAAAMSQGLTNPIKANAFLGGLINQITIDPGLRDQLVSLAGHYRHLNVGTAPQLTLPVNQVGDTGGYSYDGAAIGAVEFANQPLDNRAIATWDTSSLPTPVAPDTVQVVNATDTSGAAANVTTGLQALGVQASDAGPSPVMATPAETWVRYSPGQVAEGISVVNDLRGAVLMQPDPNVTPGLVVVEVGSLVSVAAPAGAPVDTSTSTSTTLGSGSTTTSSTDTASGTGRPHQASGSIPSNAQFDPTPSSAADRIAPWDPRPC